jgi:hypothetical protein
VASWEHGELTPGRSEFDSRRCPQYLFIWFF